MSAGSPVSHGMLRKLEMCERFGIDPTRKKLLALTTPLMDKVDACKTEECKRILLGVSK